MDSAMPTEAHEKLTALIGDWKGKVTIPPNPQMPDGAIAESRISSRFKLNQWFVISDYEQTGLAPTPYKAHGLFGWDQKREQYTFYWFDSDGWDPGKPARGNWTGNTLQLEEDSTMGTTRFTYQFTGESYQLQVENSSDRKQWNLLFTEEFKRASP